jgi:hypothetical protein
MTPARGGGTLSIDPLGEGGGISGGRPGEGNGECMIVGLELNDIVSSLSGSELGLESEPKDDEMMLNSTYLSESLSPAAYKR